MVLKLNIKLPLKAVKVSRVVFISGLLTFLYCIEFSIGVRTVYYTFKVWTNPSNKSQDRAASWTLCVACLLVATISTFSVNVISALWEQKQLEEREKKKSVIRFAFHIIVGGMIWRYISIWCIDTKEFQRKGALLLTMTKFIFTQAFTIPMVIVHVSVLDHLDEVVYDVCSIFCISVNLILTCTMFSWCSKEVEELKKWDYKTVDLVPLIFQTEPSADAEHTDGNSNNSNTDKKSQPKCETKKKCSMENIEIVIIKIIVLFQTFGFSFGRLLALGVLLKLAGIYAVSIMFLQLLISVIYLKFQAPILVSDSLPKWRQLSRLAFLSYILIFEWHLNRDPKTGYDFSSNLKHSILYYCVASIESVFYLVTWSITTSYALKSEPVDISSAQNGLCRIILVIGSMALVLSLIIHVVLLFWRSRKISVFFYSVRRRYKTAKLRLSKCVCGKEESEQNARPKRRSNIDISSPIPIKKHEDDNCNEDIKCDLEKHNSYRDLREPIDEEIEIYFRKCDKAENAKFAELNQESRVDMSEESREHSTERAIVKNLDQQLDLEINSLEESSKQSPDEICQPATIKVTDSYLSVDTVDGKNVVKGNYLEGSLKSKIIILSGSISDQFGKVSNASKKVAGSMMERIQKKKAQFENFRHNSNLNCSKTEQPRNQKSSMKAKKSDKDSGDETANKNDETLGSYFIGDSRGHQDASLESVKSVSKQVCVSNKDMPEFEDGTQTDGGAFPASDVIHKVGKSPCLCYVCKTLGEGRFRRRRSSSVPSSDRKATESDNKNGDIKTMSHYVSSPNISRDVFEERAVEQPIKVKSVVHSPEKLTKSVRNLSRMGHSVEHYV